jgi:murein DD-endopeptidase MepM/ murein hydrolase activator NlpD
MVCIVIILARRGLPVPLRGRFALRHVVWRCAVIGLLVLAAACQRGSVSGLFDRSTPHERYAKSLQQAGLAETALARDWLTASEKALSEPAAAALPLTNDLRHLPSEPRAYGYRLQLQRGRVLRVALTVEATEPALVFIDLFAAGEAGQPPRHIESAQPGATALQHEIEEDVAYIQRIQPELLRGGPLKITQRTTAALIFPVSGRTTADIQSFFRDPRNGARREHHGIDIFAPRNTPVLAAAEGYVSHVGASPLGGNVVWVWDPRRGQSHYYAHLQTQAVTTGARVKAGDVVGYVGNTGNARTTAPHLHFGIYGRGEGPIDPLPFVRGAKGPDVTPITN